MASKKSWKYPKKKNGSIPHYAASWEIRDGYYSMSEDMTPFKGKMRLDGYSRGRSAAYFDVKNDMTGAEYTIFLTDMMNILEKHSVQQGQIIHRGGSDFTLMWVPTKRGDNYGVKVYEYETD